MKIGKPHPFGDKWLIRWSDENGRRCKRVFDKYVDAAHMLAVEVARVKEVKRGVRLGAPPDKTFDQLCDYWLEHRAKEKRSGYHDESIIRAHLRPTFGKLLLREIGVAEKVEHGGKTRRYLVFHDTRHTFASHWMMKGGDIFRLQKILGHKSMQMTQRYAHLAPAVFAGDHGRLGAAIPTSGGAVLAFPGSAGNGGN